MTMGWGNLFLPCHSLPATAATRAGMSRLQQWNQEFQGARKKQPVHTIDFVQSSAHDAED